MPTARLQASLTPNAIDSENGIISGVRVMELGRTATFADENGKPKTVQITAAHITALMNNAGNRAIPMHWTHSWAKDDADGLETKVGLLKNFRKDGEGNLIADAHLAPGQHRDTALWNAAHDPGNIMLSAVFDYSKRDPLCIPKDFRACDFVEKGAATTALLEESTASTSMDISEFITMLQDGSVKDALKAIIKSVEKGMDDSDAAAMESDAGVTEADMAEADKQQPALMRAFLRCNRSHKRQIAELKAAQPDVTALLAEAKTAAAAETTAMLGKGGLLRGTDANGGTEDEKYTATLAEFRKNAKSDVEAGWHLLRAHPELNDAHARHTRRRMELLAPTK